MLNLFEKFDSSSIELYFSLKRSGMLHDTFVMEDDGFLPDEIVTPYRYFSQFTCNNKAKYFNEVALPDYWEITGDNNSAVIKDLNKVKAHIIYQKDYQSRIVSRVDWLSEEGIIRYSDHYNKNGFLFARTVSDNGQAVFKHFFDQHNKIIMYENYVTGDIIVTMDNKELFFESQAHLSAYILKNSGIDASKVIFNSLGKSLFAISEYGHVKHAYLFWQEQNNDEMPGNMTHILQNQGFTTYTVIVPHQKEYEMIRNKLNKEEQHRVTAGGYVYQYLKMNQYSKNILIVTNSDQIMHLEQIALALPHYTFHIAAITEMSSKLMNLDRLSNMKLYPSATIDKIRELYSYADLYLDINFGNEILNAVRSAFDYDILILAFKDTVHNRSVTLPDLIFDGTDPEGMIGFIDRTKKDKVKALQKQKIHANEITKQAFKQLFD